ncbi:histidine kinase [Labilibaculum sp. K2S]|uniref:histidine kinase n=1 Tax=Labilibaculum sp. K2S TaxID=3056386 RepID=UPI0025A3F4F0|nr:sensor histidine kinase [Labilibaculum sp. K2S]MDM8158319.1 histidine kinase [Labilibaculum sp. K2S]
MKTNYLNHLFYRIFAPPLVAVFVYLLILLIFDRLSEIGNNFSPEEVLFLGIVTFSLFEVYRFWIFQTEKIAYLKERVLLKSFFLFMGSFIITIILVFAFFSLYFIYFLGLSAFRAELTSFLIVFTLVGILYHLFYLSIRFLDQQKALLLEKEEMNRKNIEFELQVFKNKINPDFLYQSLESVISMIRKKEVDRAEKFIDHLALFYRRILGNRYSEIISLEEEIQKVDQYLLIRNNKYNDNFIVNWNIESSLKDIHIVPNTILQVLQMIEYYQMVDLNTKLAVDVSENEDCIVFHFLSSERLTPVPKLNLQMKTLKKAIGFYSNKELVWDRKGDFTQIYIPKINLED